ncbi:MAG: GGDEF domain-containing protein [Microthrixaceae bacterium]
MQTDPPIGLPDRSGLLAGLEELIAADASPVVFAISVDGFAEMLDGDGDPVDGLELELGARLSRLVRSNDVLASLGPGLFALGGGGIEEVDAAQLLDRVRGVFAVPIEVDGDFVSLPVTVGVAHFAPKMTGRALLEAAESDLAAKQRHRG